MNDYLWDGTGEPDADLAEMEKALSTLRWPPSRELPVPRETVAHWRATAWWMTAAAGFVLLSGIFWFAYIHSSVKLTSWTLSFGGGKAKPIYVGDVIETTEGRRGTIASEFVGRVDMEPKSLLRVLAATKDQQRLALDHGTIHALIWAPPKEFVVDTPAAKAVDLGCQYTLQVNRKGLGFLTVEVGWVAFDWRGTESFIPAGATCSTRPGHGPDPPYFMDAPQTFQRALAEYEQDGSKQALFTVLESARKRDALTLWHLLQRVPSDEHGAVFDRLAELISMPPDVKRDAVLRGDRRSIDLIWDALDLGNTNWWREWKRQW
jgi:hypothetical protein